MSLSTNPFPHDADRSAIWTMLVPRDIKAYVNADWSMVEGDFVAGDFMGINGNRVDNPDGWTIRFPTLADYRDEWLRQAHEGQKTQYAEDVEAGIHRATSLTEIEISGERGNRWHGNRIGDDAIALMQKLRGPRAVGRAAHAAPPSAPIRWSEAGS